MKTPSPKIKIAIIDDHPLVREQLAQRIHREKDMIVCGEADNLHDALKVIENTKPDIAIIDITLKSSNGLELVKDLKVNDPNLPILVLSMHDESLYAERVLRAGARGYITKQEAPDKIMAAIRHVIGGQIYLSSNVTAKVLQNMAASPRQEQGPAINRLTDRELEVFRFLGQGRTTREISSELHLGMKTVETYRARMKEKLNLKNASELHHMAVQWVSEGK